MAPTITIQQVILPNVVDDVNFIRRSRRWTAARPAIWRSTRSATRTIRSRSRPTRTSTCTSAASSPHPIEHIGCTVCHEGQGQSVSFATTFHTPGSEEQKEAWEQKYGWTEPESWDYPMLPTQMTEASCAKCHKQQVFIPKATRLNVAYANVRARGLLRVPQDAGLRERAEAGADPHAHRLEADAGLGEDLDPQSEAVKPTTWMPRFWYNSNSARRKTRCATKSRSTRSWRTCSRTPSRHESAVANPPRGDAKRGEEDRQVDRLPGLPRGRRGSRERGAVRTGRSASRSRTSATRRPTSGSTTGCATRSTSARTRYMPNLRLTDAQAADVATYLSGLKGPAAAMQAQGDADRRGRRRCAARLLTRTSCRSRRRRPSSRSWIRRRSRSNWDSA